MQKYIFNEQIIDLGHTLFDAIPWDEKTGRILEVFTDEDMQNARQRKADYLLKNGQISLALEKVRDVEITSPISKSEPKEPVNPSPADQLAEDLDVDLDDDTLYVYDTESNKKPKKNK